MRRSGLPDRRFKQEGQYPGTGHHSPYTIKKIHSLVSRIPAHAFETSKAFKASKENVLEGLMAEYAQPFSLEELKFHEGDTYSGNAPFARLARVEDALIDRKQEEMLSQVEQNEFVFQLLKELASRKYIWFEVIMFRYGFWDGSLWTLAEIGEQFDPPVSREYVRQVEKRALEELGNILVEWALEFEVRHEGLRVKFREITPPAMKTQGALPTKRGRPPQIHAIPPPSELDRHSWMPIAVIAKTLGVKSHLVHKWVTFDDFPASRVIGKRKHWLLQEVLDWAFAHDRIVYQQ